MENEKKNAMNFASPVQNQFPRRNFLVMLDRTILTAERADEKWKWNMEQSKTIFCSTLRFSTPFSLADISQGANDNLANERLLGRSFHFKENQAGNELSPSLSKISFFFLHREWMRDWRECAKLIALLIYTPKKNVQINMLAVTSVRRFLSHFFWCVSANYGCATSRLEFFFFLLKKIHIKSITWIVNDVL